jgi:putative restriction endonuclease
MPTYIDAHDVTIADSFVVPPNKVESGHGEAKLYVGQRTTGEYRDFFGPTGFQLKCRLLKSDLLRFLDEMQPEYWHPTFAYRDSDMMRALWRERKKKIEALPNEKIEFFVQEQSQIDGPRGYINSSYEEYILIRELPLPGTSRLKIVKIEESAGVIYEFKLMPDFDGYSTKPIEMEAITELTEEIEESNTDILPVSTTVARIIQARLGQQQFKRKVLLDCDSICAFTRVEDPGLLIAGHIKPWAKSNDIDKLDPKNGMVFTPTYDRLFNNGLISFKDDRSLIISPLLGRHTSTLLNLFPNMEVDIPLLGPKHMARRNFMEYHRQFILRK